MRRRLSRWLLMLVLALAGACGDDGQEAFLPYDLPPELADLDLSYLPFEYLRDGCMYRAAYVGMELAVSGRPALAVQAQDCDQKRSIHGPAGERWRHHVAPAFVQDGKVRVVDPTFSDTLMTPQEWAGMLGSENLKLLYNSAAFTTGDGSAQACHTESGQENIVQSVAEMTPFGVENLGIHCSYLRRYLRDGGQDEDGSREARLVARTAALYDALLDLDLIDKMSALPAKGSFQCPDAMELP